MPDVTAPPASKPIWQSKTMWVNALTFGAGLASMPGIDILPPEAMKYVVVFSSAANLALRVVTTQGVTVSAPKA